MNFQPIFLFIIVGGIYNVFCGHEFLLFVVCLNGSFSHGKRLTLFFGLSGVSCICGCPVGELCYYEFSLSSALNFLQSWKFFISRRLMSYLYICFIVTTKKIFVKWGTCSLSLLLSTFWLAPLIY